MKIRPGKMCVDHTIKQRNLYPVQRKSSLQCYSVLSDILVKCELCIRLERGSNVLSTGKRFHLHISSQ